MDDFDDIQVEDIEPDFDDSFPMELEYPDEYYPQMFPWPDGTMRNYEYDPWLED